MTLSICIPCYNYLAEPLLRALRLEMSVVEMPIFLVEDGSELRFHSENQKAAIQHKVDYESFDRALGRSEVRNYLARKVNSDYILFLDVDSLPVSSQFIRSYFDWIGQADVVCGGTRYEENKPVENQRLRWKYGKQSEETLAEDRQKTPFERLTFNNILIRKELFLQHPLQSLKHGYGHEDTLWGLAVSGIAAIKHIDNPVFHTGLESNAIFLEKTKMAVENLAWLIRKKGFKDPSQLSQLHRNLKGSGLLNLVISLIAVFEKNIADQLVASQNPNLFYLKLLKLYWFSKAV